MNRAGKSFAVVPRRGFSLVEVTLAIGIISFALIAILATIPVGLSTISDAGQSSARAEIIRTIHSELKGTSYREVEEYFASSRFPAYFNSEGIEVPEESAVFTVVGRAKPEEADQRVRTATVYIGLHTTPLPSDPLPQKNVESFPLLLADRGH